MPKRHRLVTCKLYQLTGKLQQTCRFHQLRQLVICRLLQLVATTCCKPVGNTFWQRSCNESVDIMQQTCLHQAGASQAHASGYQLVDNEPVARALLRPDLQVSTPRTPGSDLNQPDTLLQEDTIIWNGFRLFFGSLSFLLDDVKASLESFRPLLELHQLLDLTISLLRHNDVLVFTFTELFTQFVDLLNLVALDTDAFTELYRLTSANGQIKR